MSQKRRNIEAIYPLSPLQQGMLYHSQLSPSSGVYVVQFISEITGDLNHQAFKNAWKKLIKRHAVLRTLFVNLDTEKPLQVVLKHIELPWHEEDLRGRPLKERDMRIQAILEENRYKGFPPQKGPLMLLILLRIEDRHYQFIWSHHHAVMDGWSWPIVYKELFKYYNAICQGHELELSDTHSYQDYILWRSQQDTKPAEIYWREYLRGFSAPTPLTIDDKNTSYTDKDISSYKHQLSIPKKVGDSIQQLARNEKLTLNVIMQGMWSLLLSRYSNEKDVVFGKVVSGRPPELEGVENIVGPFINTLPLRVKIDPNAKILSWLKKLHLSQIDQIQYETTSLVDIQRWSDVSGGKNLFDSIFVFENYPIDDELDSLIETSNLNLQIVDVYDKTSYPLTIIIILEKEIKLQVNFDPDLFDITTIKRLCNHYLNLLKAFIQNPDARLFGLTLLDKSEIQQILFDWNANKFTYPWNQCVHRLFEKQAKKTPNAIAVIYKDQQISYRELNTKSNQLAHYLIGQGVTPDVRVGICVERSLEMVIAILSILKAGGAYVPLDPNYPSERLDYMLKQANADIILTQKPLRKNLSLGNQRTIYLDINTDWQSANTATRKNPIIKIHPNNLAYVIFTSGSTGHPKGVTMTHRALVNLIQWQKDNSVCSGYSRTLQFSPFSFDVSFQEIFSTWSSGGQLVLITENLREDPFSLWNFLCGKQINRLFMPFIALQQLAETCNTVSNHSIPHSLMEVITAGEQLQITPLIRKLFQRLKGCQLYNHYGPSESHVVTSLSLKDSLHDWEFLPTIGTPIANNTIYITDETLHPVPLRIFGEIHIGGAGLARGYLHRPDLTAERFIPDQFNTSPGEYLYKTGDLARYRPDSSIEFKGRADQQIKIRGFRIEPGEVENIIIEQPGVHEAIVIPHVRDQATHDRYLAAYLVLEEGKEPAPNQLRQGLLSKLPEYMVPSFFIFMDKLPLTPSGKIDRKALPPPDAETLQTGEYIAPRTETEKGTVRIWAEVLSLPVDKIGIHDNFFELGGHSLLATRVISQIRKSFDVELQIKELFANNTIKQLAFVVDVAMANPSLTDDNTIPLRPIERTGNLSLSFAQQRVWFLNQFEGGTDTQYNIPWGLRLTGHLEVDAMKQSLQTIVQRHESLRTTFNTIDGEAVQIVSDELMLDIPLLNIKEEQIAQYANDYANHVFDLTNGPLIKAGILRISDQDHVLLINMHHIISDGWSIGVFNHELETLYSAYIKGEGATLPPLPIQYADFAHWQRQWLQGEVLEEQVNYWKNQLTGAPALLELPTDRPRPAIQTSRGDYYNFTLPAELTSQLNQLSQQQGVTLFMLLLAAFNVLLARYSGQRDISVGTPIANRRRAELENLIGFFVNTLVLRNQVDTKTPFKEFLQQIRTTALAAYQHQDIPFEQLVEALQPERSMSYSPLFQVMFALQNTGDESLELPGLTVTPVEGSTHTAKFDLTLGLMETEQGLEGAAEYNTDLFDRPTIERFIKHYQNLLSEIAANSQQRLFELPLLDEAERQQILFDWNNTQTDYPKDQCIHQLFEKQVAERPDAIAVVYVDQQLTYKSLNHRSNQLAHYLIKQGVKPDTTVGLCLEQSLEMIIGILGILKAGGAYIPIDSSYPQKRIEYMLNDSFISLFIIQNALLDIIKHNSNASCFCLDQNWPEISKYSTQRPDIKLRSSNLAYVIYTSGSTGKPKGVAVAHNSVNRLVFNNRYLGFNAGYNYLQSAPISFDAATFEIWAPLLHGGKCILYEEKIPTAKKLEEVIIFSNIDALWLTTALFNLIIDERPSIVSHVRHVLIGGEAVSTDHVIQAYDYCQNTQIINMYGPTENTTFTSYYSVPNKPKSPSTIPIGKPISNTSIYVLDTDLNPVVAGVAGELYTGGDGLARGYLNRPGVTAEKFIPDAFNKQPGKRLYRTGDLVRYREDGNIEFLGRTDQQVKIRGFRIELGEIENALAIQPGIRKVLVQAHTRGKTYLNQQIIAYLVLEKGVEQDANRFRQSLLSELPDYMIPSSFIFLDRLPLTPNGKVDRKLLPKIEKFTEGINNRNIIPRDNIEFRLIKIWENLLDRQAVNIRDNLFELGGNSLMALRLMSSIHDEFNLDVPLSTLFELPTIEQLASKLRCNLLNNTPWSPLVKIQTNGIYPPLFCVHPGGGTVFCYRNLANHLEKYNQPVYGLEAKGLLEGQEPHSTISEAAECYIKAMLKAQPVGPYHILGWSSGGTMAYEMAQQLYDSGEHVAFLGLLDTRICNSSMMPISDNDLIHGLLIMLTGDFSIKLPTKLADKINNLEQSSQIELLIKYGEQNGLIPSGITIDYAERLMKVQRNNSQFMWSYKPEFYKGKLIFFRATEPTHMELGGSFDWQPYVAELLEYMTPGEHVSMVIPPNIQTLSGYIWECLNKCYAEK